MGSGDGVRCMLMRGGTSKGAYFLAEDLPQDPAERDDVLLRIMGSPGARQIDGIGGAHPLTSKVAVISPSARADADVDYLFLQVGVEEPVVSDRQNCGNLLAGVGAFAVERGLVGSAPVRIHMVNSGSVATASFAGADGVVDYDGDVAIAGVPGTAAPVVLDFAGTEGSATGALLPTGHTTDVLDGITVTCIDNGMPVVLLCAADVARTGYERPEDLNADAELKARLERIRLLAGPLMGLGEVGSKVVPKMSLIAAPTAGGIIHTRTFIPRVCHAAIGVLGAVSVATACIIPGTVAEGIAVLPENGKVYSVEHPSGEFSVTLEVDYSGPQPEVLRAGLLRTARLLSRGEILIPGGIWNGQPATL